MKLCAPFALLIFVSAYAPLAFMFALIDFDCATLTFTHPLIIVPLLVLAVLSCLILRGIMASLKPATPLATVISSKSRNGDLVNYSLPYFSSLVLLNVDNIKFWLCFLFYMGLLFFLQMKTEKLFINPLLVFWGYRLYTLDYEQDGKTYSDLCLVRGARPQAHMRYRLIALTDDIYFADKEDAL